MIHHGDQEIQENDDVNNRINTEHQHAPEPGEHLDAVQFEAVEVDQAENRPEERLYCLKQTARKKFISYIKINRSGIIKLYVIIKYKTIQQLYVVKEIWILK